MTNIKKIALGLIGAAVVAVPFMAQASDDPAEVEYGYGMYGRHHRHQYSHHMNRPGRMYRDCCYYFDGYENEEEYREYQENTESNERDNFSRGGHYRMDRHGMHHRRDGYSNYNQYHRNNR